MKIARMLIVGICLMGILAPVISCNYLIETTPKKQSIIEYCEEKYPEGWFSDNWEIEREECIITKQLELRKKLLEEKGLPADNLEIKTERSKVKVEQHHYHHHYGEQ